MQYIFTFIFLLILSSCKEEVDFSTEATDHIKNYTELNKNCEDSKDQTVAKASVVPIIQDAPKPKGPFSINEDDIVQGDANAKLIFIEYFSPTCPHCAYYHKTIYPQIRKKYIDNNKIVYVIREFIGNKQDLDAAILARCLKNKDSFFKYTEVILQQQESWSLSSKYRDILTNIGQLGGLSPEKYAECLNDNNLVERLITNTRAAAKAPKFMGTPAFFINGEQYNGAYSFEAISKAVDKAMNSSAGSSNE